MKLITAFGISLGIGVGFVITALIISWLWVVIDNWVHKHISKDWRETFLIFGGLALLLGVVITPVIYNL